VNDFSIFISSSDSYADLWFLFFDLFKKYWPEYNGLIYLNTENKDFQYEGLNIKCTHVGELGSFGKVFRAGLNKVESNYVMLIMIDFFFMGKVNNQLLNEYFKYFKDNDLDSICLKTNPYTKSNPINFKDLNIVIPPSKDMFSTQIAFWKKAVLYEMVLPHETPWLAEWYGTLRANKIKLKLAYSTEGNAIPYLAGGALSKGKWAYQIVSFLKDAHYDVDFSRRGFFVKQSVTLKSRIKGRIYTFVPRCLSNIDLLKRECSDVFIRNHS